MAVTCKLRNPIVTGPATSSRLVIVAYETLALPVIQWASVPFSKDTARGPLETLDPGSGPECQEAPDGGELL